MARVFMTGLEDGSMDAFTSTNAAVSTTQKRTGAYSMYLSTSAKYGNFTFSGDKVEIYIRVGIFPTTAGFILTVYDSASAAQIQLEFAGVTFLPKLYLGIHGLGGTLIATAANPLTLNVWSCIELYIKIADAPNGRFTLKVNGVIDPSMDFTGDTQNTAIASLRTVAFGDVASTSSGMVGYLDDIAVNDTAGAVNNSWIGQGGIRLAFVDGESAAHAVDFTPSTPGTNWSLVDEIPANDADYVEDDTVDEYDLYTLDTSSMPAAGTVSAVKWIARAKLDIDGATITPVIRSESTTEQQADIAVTTTYAEKSLIMDVDPIDNAAWTLVKVNALEIGMAVG